MHYPYSFHIKTSSLSINLTTANSQQPTANHPPPLSSPIRSFLLIATLLTACTGATTVKPLPEDPRPGSLGRLGLETDTPAAPVPLLALFGGAPLPEDALDRLRRAAGGGDALILGTTSDASLSARLLGEGTASAETFRIDARSLANNTTFTNWILRAELLFLNEGPAADRFRFWLGTFTESETRFQVAQGRAAAGGAGSGAEVWGTDVFGEAEGAVGSAQALADPLAARHAVLPSPVGPHPLAMGRVVGVDVADGGEGRLVVRMARTRRAGIGIDAGAAFVIGPDSIGTAYGSAQVWLYDPLPGAFPLVMSVGMPLDWNRNRRTIRVWKLSAGDRYDFRSRQPLDRPSGYYAWVENGTFHIEADGE